MYLVHCFFYYTMTDKDGFIQTYQVNLTARTYAISSYTDAYQNEIAFKRNDKGQVTEVSETKRTRNQQKISISYTNDKISKVQYGDHRTTYQKYIGKLPSKYKKKKVKKGKNKKESMVVVKNNVLKRKRIDAHEFKKEYLGEKAPIKEYDIFRDKRTNKLYIKKKSSNIFIPSHGKL